MYKATMGRVNILNKKINQENKIINQGVKEIKNGHTAIMIQAPRPTKGKMTLS